MKKCISVLIITVMVLSMTACGSRDEIPTSEEINGQEVTLVDDFSQEEENEEALEEETVSAEITGDFNADVEAGLLWINNEGYVTDKDGNIIDTYSYIIANDNGSLSSYDSIMTGYIVDNNMRIVIDEAYLQQVAEDAANPDFASGTYYDTLLSLADPSYEGKKAQVIDIDYEWDEQTKIVDNGGPYYSEIIYGNWWVDGVNGTPVSHENPEVAVFIPSTFTDVR